MQQIPESGKNNITTQSENMLDNTIKTIQHELDILFMHHEELRAKRSLTTQQYALLVGFFGLIYFSHEEEKAASSLGIMYLPLLTSLFLHWPVWKIRKFLYLYTHHKHISREGIEDPRNDQ